MKKKTILGTIKLAIVAFLTVALGVIFSFVKSQIKMLKKEKIVSKNKNILKKEKRKKEGVDEKIKHSNNNYNDIVSGRSCRKK